jgi:hypothetical protein
MTNFIKLTLASPPPQGANICCPSCGALLLHVYSDRCEVPNRRTWLSDGDTIFGFHQRLSEAGKLSPDIGIDYELLIGHCPICTSDYFVVDALLVAAPVEFESDYADVYFRGNGDRGQETNLIVLRELSGEVKPIWWASRFETPLGPLLHHCFGPFPLQDKSMVSGPWGVMACSASPGEKSPWTFASDLLFSIWDELVDLAYRVHRGEADTDAKNSSETGYGLPSGNAINLPLGENTFFNLQSEDLSHKSSMVPPDGLSKTNANR